MLDRLRLTDVGPARELSLEAAPRLNALTGDNGLGKSFALDVVWWALTGSWAGATAAPFIQSPAGAAGRLAPRIEWALSGSAAPQVSTFDWRGVRWKRPAGERPTSALVFYARVDGSFSAWDPHRNDWKPDAADLDRPERPAAYHFHKDAVWYGLHADGADEPINEGLLRDWVRWQLKSKAGDVDDLDPFELLTAAMQTLSPTPDEVLRPGPTVRPPGATRDEPSLVFDYGIVPVRHASAGVRRILALAYLVVWSWYEHRLAASAIQTRPADRIVVLLDEVETHLHPQWQRRLMPALMTVLTGLSAGLNVQVMLTTHSPLVLASLEREDRREEPADRVAEGRPRQSAEGDARRLLLEEKEAILLGVELRLEAGRGRHSARRDMNRPSRPRTAS